MNINTITSFWRIVLVPRPLTPLAAFAYYLCFKASLGERPFLGNHVARWNVRPRRNTPKYAAGSSDFGQILDLNLLDEDLRSIIERMLSSPWVHHSRERLNTARHFFSFGTRGEAGREWCSFLGKLSLLGEASHALSYAVQAIDRIVEEGMKPEKAVQILHEALPMLKARTVPGTSVVTVPRSSRCRDGSYESPRTIERYEVRRFSKEDIFLLQGEPIVVLIGGSPNSNKSTLAASLAISFNTIIEELRSHEGEWSDLNLEAKAITLDLSTPVTNTVMENRKAPEEEYRSKKVPWSMFLARQAIAGIEKERKQSTIIFADLPGRVTDVTRALAVYGDYGIFISRDPRSKPEWEIFFQDVGVPYIGRIKSVTSPSMFIELDRRGFVGRLTRLARVASPHDPFVSQIAHILAFGILPERRWKVHCDITAQITTGKIKGT